jgi:preprotein translocase subunit SecE
LTEGVSNFLYDTRTELRKVVWPTRDQALNLTALVIGVSVAVAAFVGVVDVLLQKFFQMLAGG